MSRTEVFLDSIALMAGIVSDQGAARTLLLLGEDEKITLVVSEQAIAEVERNIANKAPKALPFAREIILTAKIQILRNPHKEEVEKYLDWTTHVADVPILVAARQAKVEFLATLDRKHLLNDPEVAERSKLRIGTPGDALAWVRDQLSKEIG